jgi:mannose-1-phosphate guanylyltransferase
MGNLWAIVLAGGEGRRLAPLTERLYGFALPKQFAVLDGHRSLLQRTVDRLLPIVSPERLVVVVPRTHERVGRDQLAQWPWAHVVVQPRNLGTGPGICCLWPTCSSEIRAPSSAWLPRTITSPTRRPRAARSGRRGTPAEELPIALVGARATRAETEYGWIEPGEVMRGCLTARAFVEKPGAERAARLLASGALWNTFLFVARARALWDRSARRMPVHASAIRGCAPVASKEKRADLRAAYSRLSACNFSCDILEREPEVALVVLEDSGWSDLGSPERVREALCGTSADRQLGGANRAS